MKIVHLADLHLGYRAYNKLNSKGLNTREVDILIAFKEALDKTAQINPDVVLVAGDIFHKPRPSNATIYQTIQLLQLFRSKCNAPIVMISGNHEMFKTVESGSILKVLETSIPNICIVDGEIKQIALDNLDLNIFCVPYNNLSTFENTIITPDKGFKYNVFMTHGSFNSPHCPELSKHETGAMIEEKHIKSDLWDYVAFGHYHKFVKLAENTYYSGAIERTSSNIWQETEPKGVIEYDLDAKELKFHELNSPRKVVDLPKLNAEIMTAEEINAYIEAEISKIKDFEKSIVRMNIENIDSVAWTNLNYSRIRELKKKAVHFRTNFLKKEIKNKITPDENETGESKDIFQYLINDIQNFELSQGIDKKEFQQLALKYLHDVSQKEIEEAK